MTDTCGEEFISAIKIDAQIEARLSQLSQLDHSRHYCERPAHHAGSHLCSDIEGNDHVYVWDTDYQYQFRPGAVTSVPSNARL